MQVDVAGVDLSSLNLVQRAAWEALLAEFVAVRVRQSVLSDHARDVQGRVQDFLDEIRDFGSDESLASGESEESGESGAEEDEARD